MDDKFNSLSRYLNIVYFARTKAVYLNILECRKFDISNNYFHIISLSFHKAHIFIITENVGPNPQLWTFDVPIYTQNISKCSPTGGNKKSLLL